MPDMYADLTRYGPGTPMGDLMREHWIPVLRSAHLEVDGPPRRVRVLGEDFVAFRDSDGAVGILDEACPHRGVSLALGRNEGCGLRCLFHGWKIDVRGKVVEAPNESAIEGFIERIPAAHHPVDEAGDLVWLYLGPRDEPPPRPVLPFVDLPDDHVFASMGVVHANWLPVLEAGFDQAHVRVLHQSALRDAYEDVTMANTMLASASTRFEFERQPYGGRWRFLEQGPDDDGEREVRVGEWVFPWWDLIGLAPDPTEDRAILLNVPVDDRTTMLWGIFYNTEHPLKEGQPGRVFAGQVRSEETFRTDLPYDPHGRDERWGQRRDLMDRHWTGIGVGRGGVGLFYEDIALMESIRPDGDRSRQHLGPSDHLITRLRHLLREAVREHQAGRVPLSVDHDVRGVIPTFGRTGA